MKYRGMESTFDGAVVEVVHHVDHDMVTAVAPTGPTVTFEALVGVHEVGQLVEVIVRRT